MCPYPLIQYLNQFLLVTQKNAEGSLSFSLSLSQVGRLMEKKHEHLLVAVQRHFVVRHFCLHMLKEMRLSKLKAFSQTDFRALLMEEPSKSQSGVSSALKVGKCVVP